MSDRIRVLALVETTKVSGPAKNLIQFARLAREGVDGMRVELEIAVFARPGDSQDFREAAVTAGVRVHLAPEHARFDRSVIATLRGLLRERRPDILQSHAVKSHFLVRYAGLRRAAPWVAFHHGYTWTDIRNRLYNALDYWSLRGADRLVVVNERFRDDLVRQRIAPARIAVVHNAIEPSWAATAREPAAAAALRSRLGIGAEQKVILIAARLSKEKDHATLLRAVAALRSRHSLSPRLIILGEGPERPRLEASVRELGLTAQAVFAGWQPSEPYYGIADVAVLSSRTEGSPNAVLEAIGAGVPLVATATGGITEMVRTGETALLVPPGDVARMADAIGGILASPALAAGLSARARQVALSRYSPEERARAICAVYGELIGKSAAT